MNKKKYNTQVMRKMARMGYSYSTVVCAIKGTRKGIKSITALKKYNALCKKFEKQNNQDVE